MKGYRPISTGAHVQRVGTHHHWTQDGGLSRTRKDGEFCRNEIGVEWNPHLPIFSSQPGKFSLQLLFTSFGSIKGECSDRKVRP